MAPRGRRLALCGVAAVLCLIGLASSGCAGRCMMAVPKQSASEIAAGTRVEHPAFEQRAIYSDPLAQEWQVADGMPTRDPIEVKRTLFWYLRAFRGSGTPMQQLCVSAQYWSVGWIYYSRSLGSEGSEHPVVVINRKVMDCSVATGRCEYAEDLGVSLEAGYLERHKTTGFTVKLTSHAGDGEFLLSVPARYVQGFLTAVPK